MIENVAQDIFTKWGIGKKDKNNGVYIFMLAGEAKVNKQVLEKRDALGVWETETINFEPNPGAKIFLIEVPLNF